VTSLSIWLHTVDQDTFPLLVGLKLLYHERKRNNRESLLFSAPGDRLMQTGKAVPTFPHSSFTISRRSPLSAAIKQVIGWSVYSCTSRK
jgi:hypothetical protein